MFVFSSPHVSSSVSSFISSSSQKGEINQFLFHCLYFKSSIQIERKIIKRNLDSFTRFRVARGKKNTHTHILFFDLSLSVQKWPQCHPVKKRKEKFVIKDTAWILSPHSLQFARHTKWQISSESVVSLSLGSGRKQTWIRWTSDERFTLLASKWCKLSPSAGGRWKMKKVIDLKQEVKWLRANNTADSANTRLAVDHHWKFWSREVWSVKAPRVQNPRLR